MLRDRQVRVHERHIELGEMEGFEQCWLSGTAAEVTPVGEMSHGRTWVAGPDQAAR